MGNESKRTLLVACGLSVALVSACGDDGGEGTRVSLRTYQSPCPAPNGIIPVPEDYGSWAAAGLANDDVPLRIDRIDYSLIGDDLDDLICDAGLEHRVRLFTSDDGIAPVSPTIEREVALPPNPPGDTDRDVTIELQDPLLLESGEKLFVAIELVGELGPEVPMVSCLKTCAVRGDPDIQGDSWFSNGATAPFAWDVYDSDEGDFAYWVTASGVAR